MVHRVGDVVALADAVRAALVEGDAHGALRWVAEFVWDVDNAAPEDRNGLLVARPPATGEGAWDAVLAGTTEMLEADP